MNLSIAFIALSPDAFPQEQGIHYYPNHKCVNISLELDYERFINATPEAAVEMMKELYLNGLRVLPLFNIQDFGCRWTD